MKSAPTPISDNDDLLSDLLDYAQEPGLKIPEYIQTAQEFSDWVRNCPEDLEFE
jgi:hypothetical protein